MIVTVVRPTRPYADLSGLTSQQVVWRGWVEREDGTETYDVQFTAALTAAEQEAVERRLTTAGDVEETLHSRAVGAYKELQAFELQANVTNADVVRIVRLLCKVARALIRLQLRRLDAAD